MRFFFLCWLCTGALLGAGAVAAQPFTFTFVMPSFPSVSYGALGAADVNGDGRFDVVAAGNTSRSASFQPASFLALSQEERWNTSGFRTFWEHVYERVDLPAAMWHAAMAWHDYDGDGDVDLAMMGTPQSRFPFEARTQVYRNDAGADGSVTLTPLTTDLPGRYGGALAWGDYDNDGDADLLLTGSTTDERLHTNLYRNDGGTFVLTDAALPDLAYGDVAWGDYDSDGDLDLALSGATTSGQFVTAVYRNDAGRFTDSGADLLGLAFSSLDWGDYDSDGDLDLAVSGGVLSEQVFDGRTRVYRNDGGSFTDLGLDLEDVVYGDAAWGDVDNDGDLDLLVTGSRAVQETRLSRIYRNQGGGQFVYALTLPGRAIVSFTWGDYDADADLDLFLTGLDERRRPLTALYRNDYRIVNTPPEAPGSLQAVTQDGTVTLSWAAAVDEQTPTSGLTYNLRVGTTPGGHDVLAPDADAATGYRYVSARGNVDHNTRWTLRALPEGTYYWSVQALDHSFSSSPFAEEGTFTVQSAGGDEVNTGTEADGALPARLALHPAYPNPSRGATTIRYDLPAVTPVTLSVYNVLGARVAHLVDRVQPAGQHHVAWDARDRAGRRVGAGVYVVRLQTGTAVRSQNVVVAH
jgi:hypothetical protein